ncbi:MAG: antibiotic biosynthesis monooxygenase [Actinobacteria bacterium]|nr:antibiotic biosynthesis monooxygenase [Actinomycetota bacterium]
MSLRPRDRDADDRQPPFVIVSDLAVEAVGADTLEQAFRSRLGEVDGWPGFLDLEVWRDERDPERFVMVSWWSTEEAYVAYMKSDAHHRSHARIPTDPAAPRATGIGRFRVVAR